MRCDDVAALVSAAFDHEIDSEVGDPTEIDASLAAMAAHLRSCDRCARFETELRLLRRVLRYEPTEMVPDLTDEILEQTTRRSPVDAPVRRRNAIRRSVRGWLVPAAAFVVAAIVGATATALIGPDGGAAYARDLPARVAADQHHVDRVRTRFEIRERGWHPSVKRRDYSGTLAYQAPERLVLELRDATEYPDQRWRPNDVDLIVDEEIAWTSARASCPLESQPACSPRRRTQQLIGREPFADDASAPLDVIVPARSFARAGPPRIVGTRRIAGRSALGVEVTAAQIEPLLDGYLAAGNFRAVHPTDRVELWLDRESSMPLSVAVFAAGSADRSRWATEQGYTDSDGLAIVEITTVEVDERPFEFSPPPPPVDASVRDAGFDRASIVPPARFPDAPRTTGIGADAVVARSATGDRLALHRTGTVMTDGGPTVVTTSFSDGRSWVKIRETAVWSGDRLFGDLGPVVRRRRLPSIGIVYIDERGTRLGIHGDGVDVEVSGSVSESELVGIVAQLGVRGEPVPEDWPEAGTAGIADARRASPSLLTVGSDSGFDRPAIRVVGTSVTLAYAGPGARGLLVTEVAGSVLGPPLDVDARSVELRDTVARFSPSIGTLEWVEEATVVALRSETLGLAELVTVADAMVQA